MKVVVLPIANIYCFEIYCIFVCSDRKNVFWSKELRRRNRCWPASSSRCKQRSTCAKLFPLVPLFTWYYRRYVLTFKIQTGISFSGMFFFIFLVFSLLFF